MTPFRLHLIYLVVIAGLVFWLMRGCGKPEPVLTKPVKTIFVKGATIIKTDTVKVDRWHRVKPDTVYLVGSDSIRKYTAVNADSSGKDSSVALVNGSMVSWYTFRECYNKTISRTDTLFITTTEPVKLRNKVCFGIYAGSQEDRFTYGLSGALITRRDDVFILQGNPLQKNLQLGYLRKISLRSNKH